MIKTSKSLSEIERNELIDNLFSGLMHFTESLQKQGVSNVDCLTKLKELMMNHEKKQLTHGMNYSHQQAIAICLAKCFLPLEKQLTAYWNAWGNVFKNNSSYMNIRETVDKNLKHMIEIDVMYKEIMKQDPKNNNVALSAVLNTHVSKCEKIEYSLKKDLESKLEDIDGFDTEEMFSIGGKIPKGAEYVTHGRAIRDTISHKKYTVDDNPNDSKITFANNKHGYNFTEIFSKEDFIEYIQSTDMLYRIMFVMQSLITLCVLLHESVDLYK